MNLSPTLSQFFSPAGLMTLINPAEAIKRGTKRVLGPEMYEQGNSDSKSPVGTEVGFYRSENSRDAARLSNQTDPARNVSVPGSRFITMVGIGGTEAYTIKPQTLVSLESDIPFMRQQALQELKRNLANFFQRFTELRTQSVHSIFANQGKIAASSTGQLLAPGASGAVNVLDFLIPATNILTADGGAGGTTNYNIGDWSNAATDIGMFLRGLSQYSIMQTGYDVPNVKYGMNIPGYLAKNTTLKDYFKLNPGMNSRITNDNDIPNGFLGCNWAPVWKAGTTTGNNVAAASFDPDYLAFHPDVSPDWWELIPCGTPIPAAGVAQGLVGNSPTIASAIDGMSIGYGYFNYTIQQVQPYAMQIVAGDYFLPALKVPKAVFIGKCR